ncbi:hypothetical protein P8452_49301 [Trifolium repens]|nr:hypothetical protein P8452_49301 [Trifolium repens]
MSDSDDSLGDAGGGLPQEPPPHSNGFIEDHNNAGGEGFANGFHAEEDDNGWGADQVAELNYWLDQPDEPDMEEQAQEPHDSDVEMEEQAQEPHDSDVDMEDPAQESDDSDEERPFGEWTQQEKELFEIALHEEGRDWGRISMFHVTTRSASDCQYYYTFLRQ